MSRPRRPTPLSSLALVAAVLAACGSAAASPSATIEPSVAESVAAPSPSPATGPIEFDSEAYGYRAVVDPELMTGAPIAASIVWDGTAAIGSTGPLVDRFPVSGGRIVFVYGAPTELELSAYADDGQRKKAAWHGCPEVPDEVDESTFGGTPALLHSFGCGGLHVLSLFAVHDGRGLVVNQIGAAGAEAANREAFEALIADWTWSP